MSGGLLGSAQSFLASLLGLARTRIELFSTELQEELTRLATALLGALVVAMLAALGIGFAAAAVLIAVREEHRLAVAAGIAIGFLVLALLAGWSLRKLAPPKPRVFDASLTELERDYEALKP